MAADLASERPELFIALHLRNNSDSPWYRQLDLGGETTSGLARRASLRTMQVAVRKFLAQTRILAHTPPERVAQMVLNFWAAVTVVLPSEWSSPRKHLLCKGVGVYALMAIAGDLVQELEGTPDKRYFVNRLSEFLTDIDWGNRGPFAGLGGEGGVKEAVAHLRAARARRALKVIING